MGLVDTAVLGRLSAAAQAGAGLGNSLTFTCSFFGMGVMMALDPLVSQAIGAGDVARARTHYWQGVWLALLTSVVVMVPVALLPFTLEPFGVAPIVAEGAREYMWWRLPGHRGRCCSSSPRAATSPAPGKVAITFWAMVIANVANLLLDLGFVFGVGPIPALGVHGRGASPRCCAPGCSWAMLLLRLRPRARRARSGASIASRCCARCASARPSGSTSSPSRACSRSPACSPGGWARRRPRRTRWRSTGRASPSAWPRASARRRRRGWAGASGAATRRRRGGQG